MSELVNKEYLSKQFTGYSEVVKEQLNKKVDKTELENYYTSDEVDEIVENFSTGDVDLSSYAKTDDVNTALELKADKTELFSGSYNDLTDKPTIPSTDGLATESYVDEALKDVDVDLSGLATKDELATKADVTHTHTLDDVTDYEAPDLSGYALKTEIPSTDGFVTEESLNTTLEDYAKSVDIVEYDDTVLIERISNVETALDNKADTSAIPDVSNFVEKEEGKGLFSGKYEDLTGSPTIPSTEGLVSEEKLAETLSDYATIDHEHDEIVGNNLTITRNASGLSYTNVNNDGNVYINSRSIPTMTKTSTSSCSTIIGGDNNTIASTVVGNNIIIEGYSNEINGRIIGGAIIGGYDNTLKATSSKNINYGGIIAGYKNEISTSNTEISYDTIVGGYQNSISENASQSSIFGGVSNKFSSTSTSKTNCVIVGGNANEISSGVDSAIFGGTSNKLTSTASGAKNNIVVGGSSNEISSLQNNNTIVGGESNKISSSALYSSVVGGMGNEIQNHYDIILGGNNNKITNGANSAVLGGNANQIVMGSYNIAGGQNNYIAASCATVFGYNLNTSSSYSTVLGTYNSYNSPDYYLCVGNGTSTARSNAMRLTTSGYLYYNTGMGAGADYAEFFEWSDGNPDKEDRCGVFVTFDFDKAYNYETPQELPKIRIANEGDYILGVISGNPSFVGNADENWKKRFLYDEFDRPILQEIQVPITEFKEVETGEYRTEIEYDDDDNEIEVQVPITEFKEVETGEYRTDIVQVPNPDYDESLVYEDRTSRKEWDTTGLLGVMSIKDDGTCEAGKFCKCGANGVATLAEERGIDTFLVLRRVNDNIVKIIFR